MAASGAAYVRDLFYTNCARSATTNCVTGGRGISLSGYFEVSIEKSTGNLASCGTKTQQRWYWAITPRMALFIGKAFGTGPDIWLNLQRRYDLWRSREEFAAKVDAIQPLRRDAA
jgi:hypothetical protein